MHAHRQFDVQHATGHLRHPQSKYRDEHAHRRDSVHRGRRGDRAAGLTLSGVSSNVTLCPMSISVRGSGANRTVTSHRPQADRDATIVVRVSDGTFTTSTNFVLTVTTTDTPPTISSIGDQVINEDASTDAIPFIVSDLKLGGKFDRGRGVFQSDTGAEREHRLWRQWLQSHGDRDARHQSERDDVDYGDRQRWVAK